MAGSAEELATAYLTLIPTLQGAENTINEQLGGSGVQSAADQAGDAVGGLFGEGFGKKFLAVAGPLLTVGALKEAAEGLYNVGSEFDEMTDAIIQGTGASGAALADLEQSAKNVATSVPVSFGEAGNIIQDLNTRMGLTGETLEDVATRAGALEKVSGEAANLETLAGSMNAWGVAGEDVAAKMDYLYGVSQATGMSFNDLTSILESTAGPLQSLGFTYEEAANMAGLLDKAGVDASGTMSRMSKALVELSEPGESAADAYQRVITEMEGFIAAGDQASAIDLASEVFGTRGAAQMVQALQSGALSFDQLKDSALGAGDGIMGTYDRVASFGEKFETFKNKLMEFIEPLASGVFDGLAEGLEWVQSLFDGMDMSGAQEMMQTIVEGLRPAFEGLGAVIQSVFPIVEPILTKLGEIFAIILPPIGALVASVGELIASVISTVWPIVEPVLNAAIGILGIACDILGQIIDIIADVVTAISDAINTYIVPAMEFWGEIWNTTIGVIIEAIGNFLDEIGGVPGICQAAFQFVTDIVAGVMKFFVDLPGNIAEAFKGLFNIITSPFRMAFNAVAGFWNDTVGQLQWEVPDWVPGIGGNTIGAPKLPILGELAEGAIATRETEAIIGEGTDPEALIPLNDRGAAFARRIGLGGDGLTREDIRDGVADALTSAGFGLYVNGRQLARVTRSDYDRAGGSATVYNRRGLAYA